FMQLDHSQIGTLCLHINSMSKFHYLKGYIPIICLPKSVDKFCFIGVFKNIKIISNTFVNILLLPLIHCDIISCPPCTTDYFVNAKYEKIGNNFVTEILQNYKKKIDKNLFELDEVYENKMHKYYLENFDKKINLNNVIILHTRDPDYLATSYLRCADINNYISSINYILDKGYSVIRLTNNKTKNLNIKGKYFELNTDILSNRKFQYYLISKCKGFIGCSSGANALGNMFEVPNLSVNLFYLSTWSIKKNDVYIFKKVKDENGNYLNYKDLFKTRFFETQGLSIYNLEKEKLNVVENSSDEIFEATKEFLLINQDNSIKPFSDLQQSFKDSIPKTSDYSFSEGRISQYFIEKHLKLF
ncbi:TIGR04372 family glycosyltransferase, partial [Candidatus Pelagibacter sp.]|nr:TIGR04372 family glycosyltransferase [Candidatus Pelagibacter sp.]